jgi:hypothetical protein
MPDDLRDRVLAAVRKGLAPPLETSKMENPRYGGYSIDSATKNAVTSQATCNRTFPNEIKGVTAVPPVSANRDSQPGKQPAEPTLAYRATSVGPDGVGCKIEIIELPQASRYRKVFAFLQLKAPALVDAARWRQAVEDGSRFLAKWGEQAERLGWTSADLFGLHTPPDKPHATYNRLSRYDATGLCWLLEGKEVIALTADTATIRNPATGSITTYRRFNKPALGPLGDSLDDIELPGWRQ